MVPGYNVVNLRGTGDNGMPPPADSPVPRWEGNATGKLEMSRCQAAAVDAVMGESGSRRSTLVSRLPIFRRSASKRQDSLPSSPSSGGVGNGVHTSSPSSTNSSSSSTGKRRSLFRTPSISFHSKRSSEPPPVSPAQPAPEAGFQRAADDGGGRCKTRHSFGFGGHRHKKISRSQTEDFDKASTNRNVFINCISSGANEGDDSGFLDDYSGSRRSSKHRKPLLPKSFSSHHRFSKHLGHAPDAAPPQDAGGDPPKTGTPGSCPGELGESSLQSPMLSEDRTTAVTPSEFVPVTEDSVSEADLLPGLSPGAPPPDDLGPLDPVDRAPFPPFPPLATADESPPDPPGEADPRPDSAPPSAEPAPPPKGEEPEEGGRESEGGAGPEQSGRGGGGGGGGSDAEERLGEQTERRHRNTVVIQEPGKGAGCIKPEARPCHLRKPHAGSVCSSVSPYREALRSERRLRSASEGAGGGPRLHLNLREPHCVEGPPLLKHRADSSSSKLGSLDVLNNLGSSELDEDDLMLDMDLSDDQRHRHVSREDSSQSLASCLALLHSPIEPSSDKVLGREPRGTESSHREGPPREPRPTSLLPSDWCFPREEELAGLDGLPFRLMQQDCTAVKTLLLRLRRTLQESTDTSPATSLHSLPISPCSEKSLPFKDPGRDEGQSIFLLLKDKDELILRLRSELDKANSAQSAPPCQKADKATQTEVGPPE
ncbi:serine-rich coiled-coil domain-containing protein 1 isoform X2 [Anguilla anguilla]|nr:serine-rich coiled-coil domain-containing protein 1 isoform X2 [Anguilla anguilla]XP_035235537.1 serine-rich coiled-coil domain-containing protein 1 isoform X2 [Anguilla anguilla]